MYDSTHAKDGNGMVSHICCFGLCAGWDSPGVVVKQPRSPATRDATGQGRYLTIKNKNVPFS